MAVYRLIRDEFSAWYLEMVKPAYQHPIDRESYEATLNYFDMLMRLLHPFMPFITEELWQHLAERKEGESIMKAQVPDNTDYDAQVIACMETAKGVVNGVRGVRAQKNISPREMLTLNVIGDRTLPYAEVIKKLAGIDRIETNQQKDAAAASFMIDTTEFNVPLTSAIDTDAELAKMEKDLAYYEDFRKKVVAKLSNERFVSKAPANVVETERQKQRDAESKIESLRQSIEALRNAR